MQEKSIEMLKTGLYRHYKGAEYIVDKVVRHSETEEFMVLYQTQYGDFSWWVRPLDMFIETVIIDGKSIQRFEWIGDAKANKK